MALAALEISGFAPPPAPMPLRAPKTPGSVKAVAATMKAAKMLERYQVTGCVSTSRDMASGRTTQDKVMDSELELGSRGEGD